MCAAAPPSSVSTPGVSKTPRAGKTRRRSKRRSSNGRIAAVASRPAASSNSGQALRFDIPQLAAPRRPASALQVDGIRPITHANTGDHAAIGQFLAVVFPGYSADQFLTTLEDPYYEPTDRLLLKRQSRILSQLRLTRREMIVEQRRLPVAGLFQLGTLPEYRGKGHASALLAAADRQMAEDRAVFGQICTDIPHFFGSSGWAVCGRHSHLRVGAGDLLAQLSMSGATATRGKSISVRPWRQVELPALIRLYAQHTRGSVGPYARSEAYWRWLLARQDHDQVYVAIRGPDKLDLEQYNQDGSRSPLVGYAVTKDDRILELVVSPQHRAAAQRLLARAAREAIEREHHAISLHAAPDDPLSNLICQAGGVHHHHESHQGHVLMAKLLDPIGYLKSLCPTLQRRADAARLPRPCELGLLLQGEKFRLVLTRRGVKLEEKKVGRSYLSCNSAEFTRLLMGHADPEEAVASGRLEASTRVALETARVLFPRQPLWRPPWDDMLP